MADQRKPRKSKTPEPGTEDTEQGDAHEVPADLLELFVAIEAGDAGLLEATP